MKRLVITALIMAAGLEASGYSDGKSGLGKNKNKTYTWERS